MKREPALLMTSDELQIIAAASDMHSVLLFQPTVSFDRARQIQAVYRLIKDGFFIQDETGLKMGPRLIPFAQIFKCTESVIVVHPAGTDTPPFCIYHDKVNHAFAIISPHENKDDTYKLCVVDEEGLMENLESLHILPVLYDDEFITHDLPDNDTKQIVDELGNELNRETLLDSIGGKLVSLFEHYSLAEEVCVESLIVFRSSPTWAFIVHSAEENKLSYYHRDKFANWLRGIKNDNC